MTDEDYKKKVDELQKNEPRKWDHIQKERNKIRDKEFNKSLKEAATHKEEVVQFLSLIHI